MLYNDQCFNEDLSQVAHHETTWYKTITSICFTFLLSPFQPHLRGLLLHGNAGRSHCSSHKLLSTFSLSSQKSFSVFASARRS